MQPALGMLTDHVNRVCERQMISLAKDEAREIAQRLLAEGCLSKLQATSGRIVALMQDLRSGQRPAAARRLAVDTVAATLSAENPGMNFFRLESPGIAVAVRFDCHVQMDGREIALRPAASLPQTESEAVDVEALRIGAVPAAREMREGLSKVVAAFGGEADILLRSQGDDWEKQTFVETFERIASKVLETRRFNASSGASKLAKTLRHSMDEALSEHSAALAGARFRRTAGYDDYVGMFPLARSLKRKLLLLVGPTNSGKTHEALQIARKAGSARVLSPLRLLALEHYEAMAASGLSAGMLTGEEELGDPEATHVAQTIETLSTSHAVDVGVIDEIQMLADRDRGWAWTEAIIGMPAKQVVMTGSLDTVEMVTRIAARTGEPLEVRRLMRKSPLHAMERAVRLDEIKRGDAIVAFSRRGLFEMREAVTRLGLTVATVYGALSPEVRRAEARRFREGEADVLIATDAIGMGLNIGPLARVVFGSLTKFDGVGSRWLTDSEIRQIAGRAGRYGHAKEGFAGVLDGNNPKRLASALAADPRPLEREKLYVRPTMRSMSIGEEAFGASKFLPLFDKVADNLAHGSDLIELADLTASRAIAQMLSSLPLSIREAFLYSTAPVERDSQGAMGELLAWATDHVEGREVNPPFFSPKSLETLEFASKMTTLYLWLSRKFPEAYVHREEALSRRAEIDELIEQGLLATSRARGKERKPRKVAV